MEDFPPNEDIKLYSYKNLFKEFYFRFRISDVLHVCFLCIQLLTLIKDVIDTALNKK